MKENSSLCVGFRSWSFAMFHGYSLKQPMALSNIGRRSSSLMCELYQWPHLGQPPTWCLLDPTASWKHRYNQLSSVAQSCPILCDPMDCSKPGLLIPHHLPKFAQVHVHCIGDAIQPSYPLILSSPSIHVQYCTPISPICFMLISRI